MQPSISLWAKNVLRGYKRHGRHSARYLILVELQRSAQSSSAKAENNPGDAREKGAKKRAACPYPM